MRRNSRTFWRELPPPPDYAPVRDAIAESADMRAAAALQLFAAMPPSTSVFANPVRYHLSVPCNGEHVELSIRSFGLRGCLLEEDIVNGIADPIRTIFVGLFGRFPRSNELRAFSNHLNNVVA